jgi:hypothetical protein
VGPAAADGAAANFAQADESLDAIALSLKNTIGRSFS